MRRAPIVITATVVGLLGVLEFHPKSSSLSLGSLPAAGAAATSAATAPAKGSSASAAPPRSGSNRSPAATQPSATRTAVGPAINYNYGVLSVSVTVSGTKVTKVGIASIDDYGSQRSQYIDEDSVPQLEQEALQAQSANIQGVSGASYTSQGFQQSLQGALSKLGLS
jgi:uncharacterized protein with FMN-binding domain